MVERGSWFRDFSRGLAYCDEYYSIGQETNRKALPSVVYVIQMIQSGAQEMAPVWVPKTSTRGPWTRLFSTRCSGDVGNFCGMHVNTTPHSVAAKWSIIPFFTWCSEKQPWVLQGRHLSKSCWYSCCCATWSFLNAAVVTASSVRIPRKTSLWFLLLQKAHRTWD